jgi:UDPglucose 6-dehydrogenase
LELILSKSVCNITVVGAGYVGISNALLLSQYNKVKVFDFDSDKIKKLKNRISPLDDDLVIDWLKNKSLNLHPVSCKIEAYQNADYVVVAVPTNYDEITNKFDLGAVKAVIADALSYNPAANVVIKSTMPIGGTEELKKFFGNSDITFSPEFLREGSALHDNLYPSRIIIGGSSEAAKKFGNLLKSGGLADNTELLFMGSTEAEAVKLFSNTYLAMRISYFNELDSFAGIKGLSTKDIIDGVALDPRIGGHYNNPSFGYGGYCLPKDTKQLRANFDNVPERLMSAIVDSNATRMDHLAAQIIATGSKIVGAFRIVMKSGSDNFRVSATEGIINRLMAAGLQVVIYEPRMAASEVFGCSVIRDFDHFEAAVDLIFANRNDALLDGISKLLITRDIYGDN